MARFGSAAIVALLLSASCLFPSLDTLEGNGNAPAEDAGEVDSGREQQQITCDDKRCVIPYQVCCTAEPVGCIGASNTSCDGMRIACDGDEDCAGTSEGKICCLVDAKTIGCRPTCAKPVCTSDPSRCTDGTTCKDIPSSGRNKACQ
jgi:hypothetical protein